MYKIIETPHAPEGRVREIIIGKKYIKSLENALKCYDIDIICLEYNPYVDERLSSHADLSAVHMGGNRLILSKYLEDSEIVHNLTKEGFVIQMVRDAESKHYPDDCGMNICILNDKVICDPETAYPELIKGRTIIKCRQGYTKCSVLVVDDNTIITSDKTISIKSSEQGIDSLLIDDSFVRLEGFNKGFIGGAGFKISKNILAFTGIIPYEETRLLIESFLEKHNVSAVYLTNEIVFDIGSAIPISEQI